MANLCLSILVLSCFHIVFANICSKEFYTHESCDECIRCGGSWCHENLGEDKHCAQAPGDNWCSDVGSKERLHSIRPIIDDSDSKLTPRYTEATLIPGTMDKLKFYYKSEMLLDETITFPNTTQTTHLETRTAENECTNSSCRLTIEVSTLPDFCLRNGTIDEVVYVVVTLVGGIEAAVKYHVPCACECSKTTEKKSPKCNGNGDLTCGACKCYKGTFGDFCDECPEQESGRRGDLRCEPEHGTKKTCSGNGYCGPCETCVCYPDGEGSQYFDHTNYCADICTTIRMSSECEACLKNGSLGPCPKECPNVTVQKYNEAIAEERDDSNRRIWAHCNETVDQCYLEYVAMKHEGNNSIVVMVNKSCNNIVGADAMVTTKVPLIVGVLGLIAAAAAVAGIMLWKHMNTVPPLPLTDPKYENIDAEDCIGENPLYKPPTSSFKNPTYGKW